MPVYDQQGINCQLLKFSIFDQSSVSMNGLIGTASIGLVPISTVFVCIWPRPIYQPYTCTRRPTMVFLHDKVPTPGLNIGLKQLISHRRVNKGMKKSRNFTISLRPINKIPDRTRIYMEYGITEYGIME